MEAHENKTKLLLVRHRLLLLLLLFLSHLRRSFPLLFAHADSVQADAGFETLGAHAARLVVQVL